MRIRHIRPPQIHWHRYFERKVIVLAGIAAVTYFLEAELHMWVSVTSNVHHMTLGVLLEHLFFGIPFEEN